MVVSPSPATPSEPASGGRIPGKTCGSCTLCCKLFAVPPVDDKPPGVWCRHCTPGAGCGIWATRPEFCRVYFCHWHYDASLGLEWRPEVARFIVSREPRGGGVLSVVTDPGHRTAWRREPYHSRLRGLSRRLIEQDAGVLLLIDGDRKSIILPDDEVFVGKRDTHARVRFEMPDEDGVRRYKVVFLEEPHQPSAAAPQPEV